MEMRRIAARRGSSQLARRERARASRTGRKGVCVVSTLAPTSVFLFWGPLSLPFGGFLYCHQDQVVLEPCLSQFVFEQCHSKSPRCSHNDELTMSGRKNGLARHTSPCYIERASAGHCSKPVNNPAGDRTVSCYLLGYRPYSFRCPADLRPVVAATSA